MAKLKSKTSTKSTSARKTAKSSAKSSGKTTGAASLQDIQNKAEQVSRSIVESAQQIWLAGVGAFGRAQDEGTRLFEALVKEGMTMEKTTRSMATDQVDKVRDAVEDRVGQARERASDTWDRLEKVFEERVQRALTRLGVPGHDELIALTKRVDALTAELRRQANAQTTARPAKATTGKTVAKPAKTATPVARNAGKSASGKRKVPQAPRPMAPGKA